MRVGHPGKEGPWSPCEGRLGTDGQKEQAVVHMGADRGSVNAQTLADRSCWALHRDEGMLRPAAGSLDYVGRALTNRG